MRQAPRPVTGTEWLRRANTAAVLRSLRHDGPASRSELAERTGLAKATVGAIAAELEDRGAVAETTEPPASATVRGRPRRPLSLTGHGLVGLGFEVNVDYVSAVAVDLAGDVVLSRSRGLDGAGASDALSGLVAETARALSGRRLAGVTVGVPGLVQADDRTVAWAPNLRLDDPRLSELVGGVLAREHDGAVPSVRVLNDANCAAYAETRRGAAAGVAHALYLTGTIGIGAGVVIDGRLLRGAAGFAGEVGHLPLGRPEDRCGCGRAGCLEASVGLMALCRAAGLPPGGTPTAVAREVAARAAGDAAVRGAVGDLGRLLGSGLAALATVLDPSVIVLGGYFSELGDLVLEPARAELDARLPSPAQPRPQLRASELGLVAAATGAAERSWDDVMDGSAALP
ncbi:putative NBD/HSP70 family sugar kinase [Nocardioides marinus]|uniref:Putative NBD/HSP70 family sugar kinase n=2 Tax=Nocardioides marinus TaxID=374514 RepID=A0A7Y9YD92_9ACTN|nr:putative NBD/HSP70 family sugar kinase [Nocardioides marinus]